VKVAAGAKITLVTEEESEAGEASGDGLPEATGPSLDDLRQEKLDPLRVLEAALFVANKPVFEKDLADAAQVSRESARRLLAELARSLDESGSALEVSEKEGYWLLHARQRFLAQAARFSKKTDLTRKATRMLGLIAKKKQLLQKELPKYFRGEIYAYVAELKEKGYLDAKKFGNTRLLKPSQKFFDEFQLSE